MDKRPTDNLYRAAIRAKILAALAAARAVKDIKHRGLKGRVREILISDLFRPLFPADISIASGQIIECYTGRLSKQHAIILFDGAILPPIIFDASAAIVPIESVLYTIEVKSVLTKSELASAHKSAHDLTTFKYLAGTSMQNGKPVQHLVPRLRSVLFALGTDLVDETNEAQRYRAVYKTGEPPLRAICVAGKGYWFEADGSWFCIDNRDPADDVLALIGGVMNTYKSVAAGRGMQHLGHYLIEPPNDLVSVPSGTKPTLRVKCNNCGKNAVVFFNQKVPETQVWPSGFVSPDRCHACGGELTCPAGTYLLEEGLYRFAG
jgi:hypothetical protein